MGKINSRELLVNSIKRDLDKELREILNAEPQLKDEYINKSQDSTCLTIAAYCGSKISSRVLIELGCDLNKQDKREGMTPMMIACKRNHLQLVKLYHQNGANPSIRSNKDLNSLDYSILQGNYQISYFLFVEGVLRASKTLNEYIRINLEEDYALFNLPLYYQSLIEKTEPGAVQSFIISNDKKKSKGSLNLP